MTPDKSSLIICDECQSEFYKETSKMKNLCPECAHLLYGYENCIHKFESGRCLKCYWNGDSSEYLNKIKK